jgi:hypothetical protein
MVARAARHGERARHRWRVGAGLLVLAVFVGIGIVPARRGLTVRYHGPPKRAARAGRRRRPRQSRLWRWLRRR